MADYFENDGSVSSDLPPDISTPTSDFSDPYVGDGSGVNYGTSTYNADGSTTYTDPDGQTYTVKADGTITGGSGQDAWVYDPKTGESTYLSDTVTTPGGAPTGTGSTPAKGTTTPTKPLSAVTSWLNKTLGTNLTDAQISAMGIGAGALAGIAGLNKPNVTKVGYQGGIPELQANRTMMTAPPAGHRPGSGGINWGGDVVYSPKGTAAAAPGGSYTPPADQTDTRPVYPGPDKTGLTGGPGMPLGGWRGSDIPFEPTIRDYVIAPRAPTTVPSYSDYYKNNEDRLAARKGQIITTDEYVGPTLTEAQWRAQQPAATSPTQNAAHGGLMGLAHGGRYLQGSTDGMADKLRTSIDGKQPAALSHGEFVIPADVVSHLGNGNSDAGAKKLYSMMDKIRQARTGTKKQGKQINPDKFMPGGLAQAYAQGGEVRHFATGDSVPAGTTGVEQAPASWAGSYVTNMLGQGQALANAPYQQYQGPLTAGASNLQNTAFNAAGNLQTPGAIGQAAETAGQIGQKAQGLAYTPQTTSFNADQAQQYMNPYLQTSLNPQLAEARRQSEITAQQNNAAMTKAGAFGGGRQAILTAENQRNLGSNLANITGQGYNTAYTNAMQQFNADQARKAQEAQFGANYGLQGLQAGLQAASTQGQLGATQNQANLANISEQANLGNVQRGIESEGIAADKAAFTEARDNPYKMVQFQQSLLNGLPISATNYTQAQPSTFSNIAGGATTVDQLLKVLGLSQTPAATTPVK